MGYFKGLGRLFALMLCIGIGGIGHTAQAEAKFKQTSFTFTAQLNQKFNLDLYTLLDAPASGQETWKTSNSKPAWLTLDSANHHLSGTPKAGDTGGTFDLTFQDAENGGRAQVTINILAPPVWKVADIDLGIQQEDTAWKHDLNDDILSNAGGGTLQFSSPNLPGWMTLTPDGKLAGTPKRADVGTYSGIIFIASATGGPAQAKAHGQVLKTVHAPKWTANPIDLGIFPEDANLSKELAGYVLNFEGTPLTFSIASPVPPAWLSITSTGNLFGTPRASAVGNVSVDVKFSTTIDGNVYVGTTTFNFTVQHVNHAPYWTENPLRLPDAFTSVNYNQSVSLSAKDPDNDTLTFALVSGPAWVKVSATGVVTGNPDSTFVGPASFTVSVKDAGGLSATTTVNLTVIQSPLPPFWLTHPVNLAEASEDQTFVADLTKYAKDPQNAKMTFTVLSSPAWFSVGADGSVTGLPTASDVGLSKVSVRVSNNVAQGGDVTDIIVLVKHVNHPPQWTLNPIQISTPEEKAFTANIAGYAFDNDPSATDPGKKETAFLTFSSISGPAWAQLSPKGVFTGTPGIENEGANNFVVQVADPNGATANVQVVINVTHVNHPPKFTENPITLPNGKEQTDYAGTIAGKAIDPDKNDTLVYSKISGPAWVIVNSDGSISGSPTRADVGLNKVMVQVADGANATDTAEVDITIEKVNQAPYWRQNPVQLGQANEDKMFNFDLMNPVKYAADPDGDTLTFSKVSGPDWIMVNSAGVVTGLPSKKDVGSFTVKLQVSDGTLTATVDAVGTVVHTPHPPVIAAEGPSFIVKERQVLAQSIKSFITDPDELPYTCQLLDNADWVQLTPSCDLTLSPIHKDLGDHTLRFQVTDSNPLSVTGVIKVKVIPDPRPPVCDNPIAFEAKTNTEFSESLAGHCRELDGRPLAYTKKDGNAWLVVASNGGALTGTPKDADFGMDKFTIHVCNDAEMCTDTTVNINVKYGTKIDEIAIDSPVPNAPAEQLWVVDNSSRCATFIRELKAHVNTFFDALNAAKVHFAAAMLSSDARIFKGDPIKLKGGASLMLWSDTNVATDFMKRIDAAYSGGPCSNCDNSPLWSMKMFYDKAPTLGDIYRNGYFMAQEPMDAMIVTNQLDHYARYAKGTPQQNWTATDYAQSFNEFHRAQTQSFRVSAIAPECPGQGFIEGSSEGVDPYRTLVQKTNGTYYPLACRFDMKKVMANFAQEVIFRAYVFAKHRTKLSKTPTDLTTITVSIAGQNIPADAGIWSYDSATNEVVVEWTLVDPKLIKAGAKLVIQYRVS